MAEVTAFTAERSQAIEDGAITDAHLDGDDLILTPTGFATNPGTYPEINVGSVRGPQGVQGPVGEVTEVELANAIASAVPAGQVSMFAGAAAPAGYLLCNGAAVNRVTYAALFTAIGTQWGVGDGTTTFNVPDISDRFPVGKGVAGYSDTLGELGGSKDATLPTHTHTGPSHTHTGPSHTHSGPSHSHSIDHNHPATATSSDGSHQHEYYTYDQASTGGTGGTLRPNASVVFNTDPLGAHTHTLDLPNFTGSSGLSGTGVTGAAGTGATGASGTDPTGSAGESAVDKNLPPYVVMNFIIKT